jgi:xanthine dehydrogenase accessory factor
MRDVMNDIDRWRANGKPVALATVIQTWGSSPRKAGAKMAMTAQEEITGSVSGGCVEGAVYDCGVETLKTRKPQLLHFGVADETAWEVGLACGGSIDVFVKPLNDALYQAARTVVIEDKAAALLTIIRGADLIIGEEMLCRADGVTVGGIGSGLDEAAFIAMKAALASRQSARVNLDDSTEAFIEVILPSPQLIAVGGVHITMALVELARTLGYRTVVIDPRSAFGNAGRFANVDMLIQKWPDEALREIEIHHSTAMAMLTHDPKLDDPALKIALTSPAFYVGALGSKKTQAARRERLLADGVSEAHLKRLRGPIGLEIGASSPQEIALAIMAEIITAQNGKLK